MKLTSLLLPAAALGTAAALIVPAERTDAYTIIHNGLSTALGGNLMGAGSFFAIG